MQKSFGNIETEAPDYLTSSPSSKPPVTLEKGGVTAQFDFNEYLDGSGNLYSKAMVYYYLESSGLYYNGVYASIPFVNSFSINF